jgi:hypothetical protein
MRQRITIRCLVVVLMGAVASEPALALEEPDVAGNAFQRFQKQAAEMSAHGKARRTAPAFTAHRAFWQCSDGETTLTVDLRGNASYKRVRGWLPEAPPGRKASSGHPNRSLDDSSLIQKTRQLASPWLPEEELRTLKPALKRETLLLAKPPAGTITELPGRTIIRLLGPDDIGGGSFQAVFDPTGGLLRMDVAFANARTKDLCTRSLLKTNSAILVVVARPIR